jgi:type I restriction enzyme S subunit
MSSERPMVSLRDAGVKLIDCVHKTPEAAATGFPYIAIPQMVEGRIDLNSARRISEKDMLEWNIKCDPSEGDIVLSRRCNPGVTAVIPKGFRGSLGQNLVLLRSVDNRILPEYLRWVTRGREWWNEVDRYINVGAVFESLRCADIPEFQIPLPCLSEQKAIAHILGTLDDKIELNRKTNETLEAMAKALFKSWFVDFDPVKAKAEGRPTGFPAEVSDLFPDSFEDSELGEIPSGWKCSPLADRALYLSRGISPAYCEEGGILVLNQKCVRDSRISFEKARRHDTTRKQIIGREVRRFDALVNSTGVGTLGRVAMMPICQEEVVVDSHVTVVRGGDNKESFFISSTLLNRQTEIEALGEGSTGQTELSRVVLGSLPIIFPSSELISAYFESAYTFQNKIEKNDQASVALASARDTLLPKLISGEIRIPDAERMLEELGI